MTLCVRSQAAQRRRRWLTLLLAGLGLLLALLTPVSFLILNVPRWSGMVAMPCFILLAVVSWVLLLEVLVGGETGLQQWRRGRRVARAAAVWGLRRRAGVDEDELQSFDDLPLFGFARECTFWTSPWALEGTIAGFKVRIFDLAFQGRFPWLAPIVHRSVQTVALVPGLALGLRFYRGPAGSLREQLAPGWPYAQGLLLAVDLTGAEPKDRGVLLAEPAGPVQAVLSPRRQHELALMRDWVVESNGDSLLIFQHEKVVPPEEMPRFLEALRRIFGALTEPADEPGHPSLAVCSALSIQPLSRFSPAPETPGD